MTPENEQVMKNCMQTETYEKCKLEKCRACRARMDCDKNTWVSMGGTE